MGRTWPVGGVAIWGACVFWVCHLKPSTKSFALDHLSSDKTTGANDYDVFPGNVYLEKIPSKEGGGDNLEDKP